MKTSKLFLIFLFVFSIIPFLSNYQNYLVNINQVLILKGVMNSEFKLDQKTFNRLNFGYPSLTNTSIPIKTIIGRYLLQNDSILKGMDYLRKGNLDNPYLGYSDMTFADFYEEIGIKDSFEYYTRRAYSKLPNAPGNFINMTRLYYIENKLDSLSIIFDKISSRVQDEQVYRIYLAAALENKEAFDSISLRENALKARAFFSNTKEILLLSDYIVYGKENIQRSIKISEKAKQTFELDQTKAIELINQAINLSPNNINNYEVLIQMHFSRNDFKSVVEVFNKLTELEMLGINIEIIELIMISLLNTNDINRGCYLASVLQENNYNISISALQACAIK